MAFLPNDPLKQKIKSSGFNLPLLNASYCFWVRYNKLSSNIFPSFRFIALINGIPDSEDNLLLAG